MKQSTILTRTLQSLFTIEEQKQLLQTISYHDSARKFTVRESLKFWLYASLGKWSSFRESEEQMKAHSDLVHVDHSTLSKKASEIPFSFYQQAFNLICSKCNRKQKRRLSLPVFAVDSTTITVGMGRLPWAYFRGEKSGVKLHIRFQLNTGMPTTVLENDCSST